MKPKVWHCKSDRGVSTASNGHLALLISLPTTAREMVWLRTGLVLIWHSYCPASPWLTSLMTSCHSPPLRSCLTASRGSCNVMHTDQSPQRRVTPFSPHFWTSNPFQIFQKWLFLCKKLSVKSHVVLHHWLLQTNCLLWLRSILSGN